MKVREPALLVFQPPRPESGRPLIYMFWVSGFDFITRKLEGLKGVAGRQRTPLPDIILVRNDCEGERADSPCFPAPKASFGRAGLI